VAGCRGPAAPAPHAVHYALAWDRDGVAAGPAGWDVTTDRGYRVHVARGWVTAYSMELVECPKATSLRDLLAPPRAWAGHTSGTPNPAAIRPLQVESLTEPEDRDVGTVTLAPQAYCQVHYLIARAARESPGLPRDIDMVDASLHVEGTYQAADAAAPTPFAIHTPIANGGLFDHTATSAPIAVDTGREAARVTIRRRLRAIFDGVDFAKTTDAVRAERILAAIVDHAGVEIAITR